MRPPAAPGALPSTRPLFAPSLRAGPRPPRADPRRQPRGPPRPAAVEGGHPSSSSAYPPKSARAAARAPAAEEGRSHGQAASGATPSRPARADPTAGRGSGAGTGPGSRGRRRTRGVGASGRGRRRRSYPLDEPPQSKALGWWHLLTLRWTVWLSLGLGLLGPGPPPSLPGPVLRLVGRVGGLVRPPAGPRSGRGLLLRLRRPRLVHAPGRHRSPARPRGAVGSPRSRFGGSASLRSPRSTDERRRWAGEARRRLDRGPPRAPGRPRVSRPGRVTAGPRTGSRAAPSGSSVLG